MGGGSEAEDGAQDVLVISDAAGRLYLLHRETLEAGRVFEELRGRVETLMAGPDALEVGASAGPYRVVRTIRIPPGASPAETIRAALQSLEQPDPGR